MEAEHDPFQYSPLCEGKLRLYRTGHRQSENLRRRPLYQALQSATGGNDRRLQGAADHLRHLGHGAGGAATGREARRRGHCAVVHLRKHGQRLCAAGREDRLCGRGSCHHEHGSRLCGGCRYLENQSHRPGALRGRLLRYGRDQRHCGGASPEGDGGCGAGRELHLQGTGGRQPERRGLLQLS